MNKNIFIDLFRDKIRISFDYDKFLLDNSITITEEAVKAEKLLNYFVPKFEKDGRCDNRGIAEKILDPHVIPVTVQKASINPTDWDLPPNKTKLRVEDLNPIPVATDLNSSKTLILDSNHTIVNLVGKVSVATRIPIVRITGRNLDTIIIDFRILNRAQVEL